MRCPNCGYDNPEGRRYCEECGEKIVDLEALKARARRKALREAARIRREAERRGLDRERVERRLRRRRRLSAPWVGLALVALVILVVVVLAVTLTREKVSDPEKAVREFFRSMAEMDLMTYLKHTEPQLYKMAQRGEYEPDRYALLDYDRYQVTDIRTELVSEGEDVAVVRVIGGTFRGRNEMGEEESEVDFSQYPREIKLIKIEDTWVVADYGVMKLPYPLPEILPEGEETVPSEEPQPD
ncbi:MAG: zinc ribbon domain-containing protein [Candidatus Geothermincolales bacterium]